jgi:hypothetical protein
VAYQSYTMTLVLMTMIQSYLKIGFTGLRVISAGHTKADVSLAIVKHRHHL